jgi:hypothetical protein
MFLSLKLGFCWKRRGWRGDSYDDEKFKDCSSRFTSNLLEEKTFFSFLTYIQSCSPSAKYHSVIGYPCGKIFLCVFFAFSSGEQPNVN